MNNFEFKSDTILDDILSNVSLNTPIDICKLSDKFSKMVWERKLGNSSSKEFLKLWSKIFQTLNEVDRCNSGSAYNKYYVIPAPTGSGKTQCFRFYAAELAMQNKRIGVLILSKFKLEVDETVEQINELVGKEVAVAYYTGTEVKDQHNEEELDKYQIVVTTQQYFKLNHHDNAKDKANYNKVMSFNGDKRSVVIVDEAIDLLDTFVITKNLITILETKVHTLSRKTESKELESESKLLTYINNNFKTLFFNDYVKTKARYVDDKLPTLRNISLELNESIDTVILPKINTQ